MSELGINQLWDFIHTKDEEINKLEDELAKKEGCLEALHKRLQETEKGISADVQEKIAEMVVNEFKCRSCSSFIDCMVEEKRCDRFVDFKKYYSKLISGVVNRK